ncbi:alpha/beta fold hydrolase [Angustibacter sp. McL0619]|uniref:alpha/beta fold hydrolase n=1 Tax=Angustibacter sp. McL0619 TaxID=3415676 RepID=UPI003CF546AF
MSSAAAATPSPSGRDAACRSTVRRARATSAMVSLGARTLLSPSGVRGAVIEGAWLATHLALYPLGVLSPSERSDPEHRQYGVGHLPPVQRGLLIGDVEAAGTPILLVHGLVDNRSIFTLLRRGLLRRGFGRVHSINYSPLTTDIRTAARRLAEAVEQITGETGYERIHVVGHSLGGLIARYYVQRLDGDQRVHTLVTLGSPHAGTKAAYLLPARLGRQLRPGSDVLAELDEPSPGCRTRFVAYWSDLDQLIVPQRNARLVHPDLSARNELVRRVGHMSLPIDLRVVHGVCTELAQLDVDGSTLQAGVSPLPARRAGTGDGAQRRAASDGPRERSSVLVDHGLDHAR